MTAEPKKRKSVNQDSRHGAAVLVDGARRAAGVVGRHAAVPAQPQKTPQKQQASQPAPQRMPQEPASANPTEQRAAQMKKRAVAKVRKERDRRSRVGRNLALFIAGVLLFAAGFGVRGFDPLMARLVPSLSTPNASQIAASASTTYNSLAPRIAEVEKIVTEESLDEYDLNAVTAAVLQDWATLTDDAYAQYFTDDRYAIYVKENTSSDYAGIGVLFAEYEGQTYAADVFPGSEAELAGVQQGDYVVAIDGNSSTQWTLSEVINSTSKPAGQSVVVTWKRPTPKSSDSNESFSTSLKCMDYKKANVTAQISNDTVGYISVSQMSANVASLVKDSIDSLAASGAQSYVLDLRGCSGGYLSQAVDIAGLFVKSGVLVQIKTKDGITTKTASGSVATTAPLVVLIDGKTAAAAEVLAAALRDNERASLVGETTIGKGSVQVVKALTFGGAFRYTAALYMSPSGHAIQGQGVTPDTVVNDPSSQLVVAQRLAQSL